MLSNHSLLTGSIQSLLQHEANFRLYTVAADDPGMSAKIKQRNPHIIIIDSGDASLGEGIITHLLVQYPGAKVIALNLNRPGVEVYRLHRVVQTDLDGLLEIIRSRKRLPRKEPRQKMPDSSVGGNGVRAMGP